jgi:hypothetical protein
VATAAIPPSIRTTAPNVSRFAGLDDVFAEINQLVAARVNRIGAIVPATDRAAGRPRGTGKSSVALALASELRIARAFGTDRIVNIGSVETPGLGGAYGPSDAATTPSIRRAGIRIVAAGGGVVAVGVLRAIPSRVVAWVTITKAVAEVIAKENVAVAKYGAAPEPTELPIKAWIEVSACEGAPTAEAAFCKRMCSAEVASTSTMTAFMSAYGNWELCNSDGERDSDEIPQPMHDYFLP